MPELVGVGTGTVVVGRENWMDRRDAGQVNRQDLLLAPPATDLVPPLFLGWFMVYAQSLWSAKSAGFLEMS